MTYGWAGTLLWVDLTQGRITRQPLDEDFALKWLGGEGFGARLLWERVGPEVKDGLDPENILVFAAGPLISTLAPSSGRLEIITKSALTGIFGDSNSGGHFAPELKQAGYDALIVTGRAERPVYIWIDDEEVEIRDAAHLWGRTVPETDDILRKELAGDDIQVACIGPGGENLVRYAAILNNRTRAAGWGGAGAVAGSKKLKAIAVRGTRGVRVARPAQFEQACWAAHRKLLTDVRLLETRRRMGTMHLMRMYHFGGYSAMRNCTISQAPDEFVEKVSGEKWADEYIVGTMGCHGCLQHCSHFAVVKNGPYKGLASEGFEFACLGPYLYSYGSDNLAFAFAAAKYCNEQGLDTTAPAGAISWATDCFQRGILTEKDTDGLVLNWGDEAVALELLRKITHREGFGDLLAEGVEKAARAVGRGSERYAQTIKGRYCYEFNAHTNYGCAIAAATSTRGCDHLKGWPQFEFSAPPPEVSQRRWGYPTTGDRRSHKGKAPMTVEGQRLHTLVDILGTCKFNGAIGLHGLNEEDYARMLSPLIGVDLSGKDLFHIADRVWNQEQAFNIRQGLGRKDDTIPEMYMKEPLNAGPLKGTVIEKEKFEMMLDDYYQLRGWDVSTGFPTRETLESLDLKDVADELASLSSLRAPSLP
ncbi:MAG: Aldehyde ferredoxin oxidoreductase [Dehalococcoidia bacterium]|nr:Aldehyde ferredoxin oxidoreductase [Dehalococcoidia bacterium]